MTTQDFTVAHDGRTTSGVKYFPARGRFPVVVFAHGYNGEARDFAPFAGFLAKNGIGAVIFTFSGGSTRDESGFLTTDMTLSTEQEDLVAVMGEARKMALSVGSDVVYMMNGGIMRAQGRGEKLTPVQGLDGLRKKFFVVAQKCMGASTAKVYSHFDTLDMQPKNGFENAVECLKSGRTEEGLYNALFLSATYHCPSIVATMFDLKNFSSAACMTGSGSACFAVFDSFERAEECLRSLKGYKFKSVLHIAD